MGCSIYSCFSRIVERGGVWLHVDNLINIPAVAISSFFLRLVAAAMQLLLSCS